MRSPDLGRLGAPERPAAERSSTSTLPPPLTGGEGTAGGAGAEQNREQRLALLALLGVACVYVLAQLLLFSPHRPFSWDEVVYLTQTTPGKVAMDWGPQRARGIALLVAPVAVFEPSFAVVRWYLILVSGAGLYLAFRSWVRVLGAAAAVAAGVFGSSWVVLHFGMEVFPNLPAALATVGTAGSIATFVHTGRRSALVGIAVGVALIALFRPADSVWLAAALLAGVAVIAWRRVVPTAVALAIGGLLGWAPWLIEMAARYGNPIRALGAATGESVSGRPRNDLDQYLNLLEGPVRLIVRDPTLTYRALAGLLLLGALVAVALLQRGRRLHRRAAVLAVFGAAGGLVPYIVLHAGVNLRYLLPAWGLAATAAGIGAAALWRAAQAARGTVLRAAATGLLVAVALLWVGGHAALAARNGRLAVNDQSVAYALAAELAEHAGDRPCAFISEFAFPQMAWATDCIGLEMDLHGSTGQCPGGSHDLGALARDGYAVFALARSDIPQGTPVARWDGERMRLRGYGRWRIYRPTPQLLGTDAMPRLPGPGEASEPCPLSRAPLAEEIKPLRIGPRSPDDTTLRHRRRHAEFGEARR